jgi:hypothetical protein
MLRISLGGSEDGGNVEGGSRFFDLLVLVGLAILEVLVKSR